MEELKNADIKLPDNIEDLKSGTLIDCVETKKVNDMRAVCSAASIGCVIVAGLLLVVAFVLPMTMTNIQPSVVWACMVMEALAFVFKNRFDWIRRNVLK